MKFIKLFAVLSCISIVLSVSMSFLLSANNENIDITKDFSIEDIAEASDLPHFKNKAQFMSLIRENFYTSNNNRWSNIFFKATTSDGGFIENNADMAESVVTEPPMAESQNSSASPDVSPGSGVTDVSETNVQVEGVDEGDILKTDGRYIYAVKNNKILIFDSKTKKTVSEFEANKGEANAYITSLYVKDGKLLLVSSFNRYYDKNGIIIRDEDESDFGKPYDGSKSYVDYYSYSYYNSKSFISATVLDITNIEKPKEARRVEFEGSLLSSREANGKLYLVINKYFNYYYGVRPMFDDVVPERYDTANPKFEVNVTDIARIPGEIQPSIMTIAVLDYNSDKIAETLEILGSGANIYMTQENLYIFGSYWSPYGGQYTSVVKYSISDGIKYVSNCKVPGYTSTQFAYDEYNGNFRIATTSTDKTYRQANNVYVFDSQLKQIGSLTGLAPNETIYSVRFMGDTAYVVTFRQVDPLFVIDMSESNPKVLGELKVPGFSTYLHPVGENLLLGIGKETKEYYYGDTITSTSVIGLKISLFDVSDKANPKETDVISLIGGENAYSEASYNHLAFVFSKNTSTGYMPITVMNNQNIKNGEFYYNGYMNGFAAIKVIDGKLDAEVKIPTQKTEYNDYYYGNGERVCYIDNELYLYQQNRLVLFDRNTLEQIEIYEID